MVSIKSLLLIAFCGAACAAPSIPVKAVDVSVPVAREVKAFDTSLAETTRSTSLSENNISDLEARDRIVRGAFNIEWIVHIDGAKDLILKAVVNYLEGQVFAAAGTGIYASPFSATGNGQGVFRVSYLSGNGVWTAVARILFDTVKGVIINAVDEGVEQNGKEIRSNINAGFKAS